MRASFVLGTLNPGTSGSNNNFIAQPGFTVAGTFAFDGQITITNASAPLSAAGPTLLIFDDFRSGTVGGNMGATTTPVSGSAHWQGVTNGHGFVPATYGSPNRSGSGFTMRLVRTTDATFNPVGERIAFGQETTGIYIFWAENSYGGDYNHFTNANGNNWNYKMHWLTENTLTGGAFNQWIPAVFSSTGATSSQFQIASNDIPPLNNWFTGDGSRFDPNNWNSCEMIFVGNTTGAPGTAGVVENITTYNLQNVTLHGQGQLSSTNPGNIAGQPQSQVPLFSSTAGANGTRATANDLEVPGTLQGYPTGTQIDRCDYYIAIGPNAAERYLIGNASTIAACTSIMPCDPVPAGWSATQQTITLRRGAAANLPGNYLYRSDGSNNISLVGQFTAGFDFYISPTGADTNLGTQASPWSLTALNTKPQIAGKRVGLLPGTYIIPYTGAVGGLNGGQLISVTNGGPTPAQPTFIGSTTPLGAIITTNNGGVYPQTTAGMFGVTSDNVTFDGIKFFQGSYGAIFVLANNLTVQNCHLEDFDLNRYTSYTANQGTSGDNVGAIYSGNANPAFNNLLISNCFVTHVRNNPNASQRTNESGLGPFYSVSNVVIEYCTVTDADSAFHWKTASGLTIRNCYLQGNSRPLTGVSSWNSGSTNPQTRLPVSITNCICIGAQMWEAGSNVTSQANITVANCSFITAGTPGTFGGLGIFSDVTNQVSFTANMYNNIFAFTGGTVPTFVFDSGSGAPSVASIFSGQVLDYNDYYYPTGSFSVVDHVANTTYTLATWKTATGGEAHTQTVNPLFVNIGGTTPASFQLQATSTLKGAGKIGGIVAGAATDMGAWGGLDFHTGLPITQIGSTVS